MSDINLTQAEADSLIAMEKHCASEDTYELVVVELVPVAFVNARFATERMFAKSVLRTFSQEMEEEATVSVAIEAKPVIVLLIAFDVLAFVVDAFSVAAFAPVASAYNRAVPALSESELGSTI